MHLLIFAAALGASLLLTAPQAASQETCRTQADVSATFLTRWPDVSVQAYDDLAMIGELVELFNRQPPLSAQLDDVDKIVIYTRTQEQNALIVYFRRDCYLGALFHPKIMLPQAPRPEA